MVWGHPANACNLNVRFMMICFIETLDIFGSLFWFWLILRHSSTHTVRLDWTQLADNIHLFEAQLFSSFRSPPLLVPLWWFQGVIQRVYKRRLQSNIQCLLINYLERTGPRRPAHINRSLHTGSSQISSETVSVRPAELHYSQSPRTDRLIFNCLPSSPGRYIN